MASLIVQYTYSNIIPVYLKVSFKQFDENIVVYGIFGIPPNTTNLQEENSAM